MRRKEVDRVSKSETGYAFFVFRPRRAGDLYRPHLILFTNQNMKNILIAMGFAHGGHTKCVAGEAVQYLTLQTKGLQPPAERRGR